VPTKKNASRTVSGGLRRLYAIMNKTCGHAHLATIDRTQPWVRSVSPIIAKDLTIWIATFSRSRKVKHILRNPMVCLQFVSQPDGNQEAVVKGRKNHQ